MGGQQGASVPIDELSSMVSRCNPALVNRPIGDFFAELLDKHGVLKVRLIQEAGLDRSYGYQILRGVRRANRDIYIKLALAMRLGIDEVQEILSITQTGVLYPRHARDAVLCYCIEKHLGIEESDRMLKGVGFEGLN